MSALLNSNPIALKIGVLSVGTVLDVTTCQALNGASDSLQLHESYAPFSETQTPGPVPKHSYIIYIYIYIYTESVALRARFLLGS